MGERKPWWSNWPIQVAIGPDDEPQKLNRLCDGCQRPSCPATCPHMPES